MNNETPNTDMNLYENKTSIRKNKMDKKKRQINQTDQSNPQRQTNLNNTNIQLCDLEVRSPICKVIFSPLLRK